MPTTKRIAFPALLLLLIACSQVPEKNEDQPKPIIEANMDIRESAGNVIPEDVDTLHIVLRSADGKPLKIRSITSVIFDPDTTDDVTDLFTISADGRMVICEKPALLFSKLSNETRNGMPLAEAWTNGRRLAIEGLDEFGQVTVSQTTFWIGSHHVAAKLIAPPSLPSLSLANIPVKLRLQGVEDIERIATSNTKGELAWRDLPAGDWDVKAQVQGENGLYYSVSGTLSVASNIGVRLQLCTTADYLTHAHCGVSVTKQLITQP